MILHHPGGCLAPEALPSLSDKSVDCFMCDAPYDKATHEKQRQGCNASYVEPTRPNATRAQTNRRRHLGFVPLSAELMHGVAAEYARLARRWVLNFCSVEMVSDWREALEIAGLEYVRTCFWRRRGGAPQFSGDRPAQAVEAIVCAHARKPGGEPMKKRWSGRGAHGWFDFDFEPDDLSEETGGDVVFEDRVVQNRKNQRLRYHPAQKPLGLMEKLVALFTDPGDLVVDAFAGSCTTLIACRRLGRRALGVEMDEAHAQVARERLAREVEAIVCPT